MKIVIAGLNYAPEATGTGRYTTEMATWFASRGHTVTAISAVPHYPEWRIREGYRGRGPFRESIAGVEVLRVPVALRDGSNGTIARIGLETSYNVAAARWWVPIVASANRPDVAIAVTPPLQDAAWPWLLGRLRGTPWLLHVQDLQVDAAVRLGMFGSGPTASLLTTIERRTLRAATAVSTISEAMLGRIRGKGVPEERAFLFPNWADLERIVPRPADRHWRRFFGAGDGDVLVLYSGNIGRKQGLEVILAAAERLASRSDIRFAVVGDGAARTDLEKRARELRLSNLGFYDLVPESDLAAALSAADVHLVLQKRAAADLVMPSKLTNILAAGRASIATTDPDTELFRVIDGAGVGLAVPPETPSELASAIEHLADHEPARSQSGTRARAYAERHLDRDRILERVEERLQTMTIRHIEGSS